MSDVRVTFYTSRTCPACRGRGCSECDRTGEKVSTHIDVGDDMALRVTGSAPLSDEAIAALAEVARAAYARMPATQKGAEAE
jgi:hypothetical protein